MFLLAVALLFASSLCVAVRGRRPGRPFKPIWTEFTVIKRGKYKGVTCNHCHSILRRVQPSRGLINHILRCPDIPEFLREQYKAAELKPRSHRDRTRNHASDDSSSDEGELEPSAVSSERECAETYKYRFQLAIALFIFRTGVAFRIVEHPSFRQMFACICPAIIMPSRHQVAGGLLDAAYLAEWKSVVAKLKDQQYVALVSDGWSNPRRESLINFIVLAPGMRPLLWTCKVTGEDRKTGAYMAEMIGEVVDEIEREIGAGKVVSITTDNASNMKSAWEILETNRPGFIATGCAAHTRSLLMKYILECPMFKTILREAKEVANFIRSHTATNARFKSIQEADQDGCQRGLKLPVATRWFSAYECIKLVMENEDVIRELFSDFDLLEGYDSDMVSRLTDLVAPDVFWAKGAVALQLLEPIHKCLAHFERDTLCLSVIFQQFVGFARHPIYNRSNPGADQRLQAFIKGRIKYRWHFIHKPAMSISYLLDHTKPTSTFVGTKKVETMMDILELAGLLGYNEQQRIELQGQLTEFLTEKLTWSDDHRTLYYRSPPSQWWTWDGADKYTLLAPIAQSVFAIPTSSAASERSWSIFKFIHSVRRNCLINETVIKLAFIYSKQGPKGATNPIVFDPVADLVPPTSSDSNSPSAAVGDSGNADLLRQIRDLEGMAENMDVHDAGNGSFDGAHWGDEGYFPDEVDAVTTEYSL